MSWDAEPSEWRKALEAYPAMIKGHETSSTGKKGLADLDHFLWDELKGAVDGRNVQFLTKDEYERVISWKLKRGKWRPRLQKFASELEADVIKEQSEKAFASLRNNEIKAAISHLAKLRGCGPATASAVLAACDDSVPFMSDELILSVPCFNGKKDYTIPVSFPS